MNQRQFSERVLDMERKLYRISRTILKSDADCQDAMQEALIKGWAKRGALRDDAAFEPWLIRILINECKQSARGSARHRHVELTEFVEAPSPPDRELHEALFSLEERYRLPVALHYVDGYSVREIAVMLRAPEGTVKSWLHTGRERLKTLLREE